MNDVSMLDAYLAKLPDTQQKVLSVLSGGMDSSILTQLLIRRYGPQQVVAVSYDYRQKQRLELERAKTLAGQLGIVHRVFNLGLLGEIAQPITANVTGSVINMPRIEEVIGDPQPVTYVPFRNLILLSLTLAQAESSNARYVFTGLQSHDEYGYWDTTFSFVEGVNQLAAMNRKYDVEILAPFVNDTKVDELHLCRALGGLELLKNTLTCYQPSERGESCGQCPSCGERIMNFALFGQADPLDYVVDVPWSALIAKYGPKSKPSRE